MQRVQYRKEKGNRSGSLRYYAFLGRDMVVFSKAVLPGECMFDLEKTVLLGRETILERTGCD